MTRPRLVAVPNISEGRRPEVVREIAGRGAIDLHIDPDHNRSVITLAGDEDAVLQDAKAILERALAVLDIRDHEGAHPRFGVLDVVPFVPYSADEQVATRVAREFGDHARMLGVPVHFYGRDLSLPDLRRQLQNNYHAPHSTGGVVCVGVRRPLIAFNINVKGTEQRARSIAKALRHLPHVRALGFALPSRGLAQVSTNLVDPAITGPRAVFEFVVSQDVEIVDVEIVGLVPAGTDVAGLPLRETPRTIEDAAA